MFTFVRFDPDMLILVRLIPEPIVIEVGEPPPSFISDGTLPLRFPHNTSAVCIERNSWSDFQTMNFIRWLPSYERLFSQWDYFLDSQPTMIISLSIKFGVISFSRKPYDIFFIFPTDLTI